jgi:hypothetical protein
MDPILRGVLKTVFPKGSPFQCLPTGVETHEVQEVVSLRAGFTRLLLGSAAQQACNAVLIWALDQPYRHTEGTCDLSTVVYIEKTDGSIYQRWNGQIAKLTRGTLATAPTDVQNLRALAKRDSLRFYRTSIGAFGPLRIWWAALSHLNSAAAQPQTSPRGWEHLLLAHYQERYGCLPLKNRKR